MGIVIGSILGKVFDILTSFLSVLGRLASIPDNKDEQVRTPTRLKRVPERIARLPKIPRFSTGVSLSVLETAGKRKQKMEKVQTRSPQMGSKTLRVPTLTIGGSSVERVSRTDRGSVGTNPRVEKLRGFFREVKGKSGQE